MSSEHVAASVASKQEKFVVVVVCVTVPTGFFALQPNHDPHHFILRFVRLTRNMSMRRHDLNGAWILDKSQKNWSMNNYLRVMHVDPVAVEAHEKGELEFDTIHTINMDRKKVKIVKRSRVNNDFVVELTFGQEELIRFASWGSPETEPGHYRRTRALENCQFVANLQRWQGFCYRH